MTFIYLTFYFLSCWYLMLLLVEMCIQYTHSIQSTSSQLVARYIFFFFSSLLFAQYISLFVIFSWTLLFLCKYLRFAVCMHGVLWHFLEIRLKQQHNDSPCYNYRANETPILLIDSDYNINVFIFTENGLSRFIVFFFFFFCFALETCEWIMIYKKKCDVSPFKYCRISSKGDE